MHLKLIIYNFMFSMYYQKCGAKVRKFSLRKKFFVVKKI